MYKKSFGILLVIALITACGAQDEAADRDKDRKINVQNTEIEHVDRWTGQQISKHLVELATGIHDVEDATAVVLGGYAIVGIDVNEKIDRSQVGRIKYTVAEALKDDPHGARAIVIADPDMTARLREMGKDIQNGEPLEGIMTELAAISGRLIPEVPADIEDPNPKNATEDPKKKLNQSEKQKLDNIQDEQSKHHMN